MSKSCLYWTFLLAFLSYVPAYTQNSVLADGQIWKIKVERTGVHKITFQDLQNAGLNPSTINPSQIQLFGNGGGMLPQANSAQRPQDLIENAIFVAGASDGRFDVTDFILFYATGADKISFDATQNQFVYEKNLYDTYNYYFLKVGSQNGKRITTSQLNQGTKITTYDELYHHELEENNVLGQLRNANGGGSGRYWYGERFDFQTDYTFNFNIKGSNGNVNLTVAAMAFASRPSEYNLAINTENVGTLSIGASELSTYAKKGRTNVQSYTQPINTENLSLKISYTKPETNAFGHLDYFTLRFKRNFDFYEQNQHFRSVAMRQHETISFELPNAPATIEVWNVSDLGQIEKLNQNQTTFFLRSERQVKELVAFNPNAELPKPVEIVGISNQNLHALDAPEYLIITHQDFLESAMRLATFHEETNKLETQVVTIDKIWNEFASGRKDVSAIRDCIRSLYLKNPSKFKYVLLFGDTSFDYKDRVQGNDNFIPNYLSRESLHPVESYSSEDFFGLLEEHEGNWEENENGNNEDLDIGIGRIPVRRSEQAALVVDKIIAYAQPQTLGKWRNQLVFVADDGDSNIHLRDTENLISSLNNEHREFSIEKLYIDAFPQISTANGKYSFAVRERINTFANTGALIFNYMGHGSESGLAQEAVIDLSSISRWDNLTNLPLLVTATCEFGRYDNPQVYSVGERLMTKDKGAIGLVTTTRPVVASTNFILNRAFYNVLFKPLADGNMPRLGDIIRQTKNQSGAITNRNFTLLGDPALRLNYPAQQAVITSLQANGQPTQFVKALDKVTLKGQIEQNGILNTTFEGTVDVSIYDKPIELRTLGDESSPMSFQDWRSVLYRGKVDVKQGKFEIHFTVSKDIDYKSDIGRVSLYAQHATQNTDANGFFDIRIGESSSTAPLDNTAPTVQLWLENKEFVSGDKVPSNTILLADISDESGINLTGFGIGREITALIDNDPAQIFVLNDYFTYDKNSSTKGSISFPLSNLKIGKHNLSLTVWDNHNNSTTVAIDFYVENKPIEITQLIAYPNPTSATVNFDITHTRTGDDIEVGIVIYDLLGRSVRTMRREFLANQGSLIGLSWNGRNNVGGLVSNGLYICKLYIHSLHDNAVGESTIKVVIERSE